jgi:hypothetical protein
VNTLLALDHAVRRFGPAVLTDPAGLRDALRTADEPPPEPAIAALTQAAATPALAWMRIALHTTPDPGDALAAGVNATRSHGHDLPAGPAAARWACVMLGAAAGVLPREWARRDTPPRACLPSLRRGLAVAALAAALAVTAAFTVASYARPAEPVPVAVVGPSSTTSFGAPPR